MWIAFSVDLEPNKDGSLDGIAGAMDWYDETIPWGTVYTTYRIATELPEVVDRLAATHELGVHVHPLEFGHEHDQLAELPRDRQRELIVRTRRAVADAAALDPDILTAFRAGRHSASHTTLDVLAELGFDVDASVNVRYTAYLPETLTRETGPFRLDSGMLELPTTWARPPLLSRPGLRIFPERTLTATANTLRTDGRGCSGLRAMKWLVDVADEGISMYMHPYDATSYHADLENGGHVFRSRLEEVFDAVGTSAEFVTVAEIES